MRPAGFALTLGGSHEEANREFEAAIRLDPKLYEGYLYYGNGRFAEGNLAEAAKLFEQAAAVRTGGLSGPGAGGLCYSGLGLESGEPRRLREVPASRGAAYRAESR